MGTRILNRVLWFAVPRSQLTELYSLVSTYNLQLHACLHRGGSLHEAGAGCQVERGAASWCRKVVPGVWCGLGTLEMEHSEHWRNLLPLLTPHYVEHNKASLIFKLVRHKCFLLPSSIFPPSA